jgi:hypothetical protein
MPLIRSTFISLSPHITLQQLLKLHTKSTKNLYEYFRNIETLFPLDQLLKLYMYTRLSHVLGNIQNNWALYMFTHTKFCIILSLCVPQHKNERYDPWLCNKLEQYFLGRNFH